MSERTRLSRAAIEKLEQELEKLVHEVKPSLVERVSQARAHGDLSENADYHAAREELAKVESRIRELDARLKSAVVIEVEDDGLVSEGKAVTLRLASGAVKKFVVASREEKGVLAGTDGAGLLSPQSPLGRACLGKRAGDRVEYETPSGPQSAEILEVRIP